MDKSPGVELAKSIINSQKKWGNQNLTITKDQLRELVNKIMQAIGAGPYDNFGFESVWNQVKSMLE